jgi:LacI family transcriptional regulator
MRDVAELAGVSTSTVSLYANYPGRVAKDRARRIQAAIDQLGFVRNNAARQLRLGESRTLAYILPDITNPFFSSIAESIEDRAGDLGLTVYIASSRGDAERESAHLAEFEEHGVRGILIASRGSVEDRLSALRLRGTPSVLIGNTARSELQASVSIDNVEGGYLAVRHLLDLGRRRIAFVGGQIGAVRVVSDRLKGASRAVQEVPSATLELITDFEEVPGGSVGDMARSLIARPQDRRPEAIFAANDMLAIQLEQVLISGGVRVPEDIALIGFYDIEYAASSLVPLSSIHPPHAEIGAQAVDILLSLDPDGEAATGARMPAPHVVFSPELIVRASTIGTEAPVVGDAADRQARSSA